MKLESFHWTLNWNLNILRGIPSKNYQYRSKKSHSGVSGLQLIAVGTLENRLYNSGLCAKSNGQRDNAVFCGSFVICECLPCVNFVLLEYTVLMVRLVYRTYTQTTSDVTMRDVVPTHRRDQTFCCVISYWLASSAQWSRSQWGFENNFLRRSRS